jgi:predicted DNA binding CopG/RHH family protein
LESQWQGYGNVYISYLALASPKGKPLPLVAVLREESILKKQSSMLNNKSISDKNKVKKKPKEKVVSARISSIEYLALKKRAKDAGVSLSRFARSVLLTGKIVQRISKSDADILRKLSGEANNLNQLARTANREGFKNVASDVINLRVIIIGIINQLSNDWKSYEKSSV